MRIAFFTPLSPIQSALADYGEGMAMALANIPGLTVDLFINDDYQPDNPVIRDRFQIRPYHDYASRAQEYDATLYSMGDHGRYHSFMLDLIHRYPGIVILNDLTVHHAVIWSTLGKGNLQAYLDELHYAGVTADISIVHQLDTRLDNEMLLKYPLFERVVDSSLGVIVQNNYARHRILAKRPQAQVQRIPYPFFMPPGFPDFDLAEERDRQRAAMDVEDSFVIGSFGIFVPNKHLEACLNAFARVANHTPQAKYILGGAVGPDYDLLNTIRRRGLEEQVVITGWLTPSQFVRQMFALDAAIHLRHPHLGGTPYTPIRLMGVGACTIVSDIEPLAELPEGACAKIIPDDYAEETLYAILYHLAQDAGFRRLMSENGRQFISRHHDIDVIAQQTVAFITAVSTS
jgi:glycosyltransferase involved in cell wall biosynthesis